MLHEVENWSRGRFLFDVTQNIVGASGDRFEDNYHMSSPVLAASATRVVMATDEGHVGFDDADEDEIAPRAFVWKTEPFLRPHREQRVCAHKITMCGEHLYAYSLERRSHVCIHHVDATK